MVQRRVSEGELLRQLPTGEVEASESLKAAAVRETAEEVGLPVEAVRQLGKRVHLKTGRQMSYAACEVASCAATVVDTEELGAPAWITHEQVAEYVPYGPFEPSSGIPGRATAAWVALAVLAIALHVKCVGRHELILDTLCPWRTETSEPLV